MFWLIGGIVILFVIWKLFFEEENPLDHLPGPKKWPIVGCAFSLLGTPYDDLFSTMLEFPKKYGYRYVLKIFSRRILHVYNVDDFEIILTHSRNITKNRPYDFLEPWLGAGLLISTGSKWHRRRKTLTPTFHFNILRNFSKVFEEKSRDLVHKLKNMPEGNVDVLSVIGDFTLYTICETAMGTQLDCDSSTSAVEYKDTIKNMGTQVISRLTKFWLHPDLLFYQTSLGKQFARNLVTAHSFADNVIAERKKRIDQEGSLVKNLEDTTKDNSKRRLALLDLLIEAESNGEIDVEGIREEVNTFMFEGHDTTAMALSFGLMLLADHEDVQERIFEECKAIFGNSDRTPSWSDLAEMKYLEATIKEILRLYPSVPFIGREITEDFMLGDILVKKGVEVLVHIYDMQRRADLYPDPEAFQPERFLNGEVRHPYAFVPFSAGPRNCIGQKFAMQEMKCALSEICRNFTLVAAERGARPKLKADIVLRPVHPIYVKFIPRSRD
ncbi:PREDICTED: cytochrome P450 4C1-like [Papilio polytes]|uniref:cytochrome P450 4C1-like n=1 Tax=Papilio polytes TaxID=76194 RepID=UPI000675DA4C|nr:PREDICTED: cytochrome P450 4C1-like [Papilio polytes]